MRDHKQMYLIVTIILYATHTLCQRNVAGDIINGSDCNGEVAEILSKIRSKMKDSNFLERKPIAAYLVPMTDAHQSEYIAEHDKRLQYISKFTGSAGDAIITHKEALLWTDSRYHLQAEQQLDSNCWTLMKKGLSDVPSQSKWLINNLAANSTVGIDPFLMTAKDFDEMNAELKTNWHELVGIKNNIVDAVWKTRPQPPQTQLTPLEIKYSGKEAGLKIAEIMDKIRNEDSESIFISALDDIAWLLNLRGADISYNPLFFSYVLLSPETSYFLVDANKVGNNTKVQMEDEKVNLTIRDYGDILYAVAEIVNSTEGKIMLSSSVSQAVASLIPQERRVISDTIATMKSVKNRIEAENMEKAHIRDGVALVQYLHWLNSTIDSNNVTELSGAEKLSEFRAQQENFRGLSFEAISAVGEHAAMAHYSPTAETAKRITRKNIYLIDSGGHYWDGTTDVTRTVHFGTPTEEERDCYTRVLKGFVALTLSVFPRKTPLSYFDNIARRSLWQAGLDYGHGTGHGVGMYLSVHEYPPLINSKGTNTLEKNVFMSNEPGYYKENQFGIRIEDVIQVIESDMKDAFSGQGALTFKSITYAPIQTKLINTDMLTKEEANFVNNYNKRVLDTVGEILLNHQQNDTYAWLVHETRKICSWAK